MANPKSDKSGSVMRGVISIFALLWCSDSKVLLADESALIDETVLKALISETSGTQGLDHFSHIVSQFSGFSPSAGADQTAQYIAQKVRDWGLTDVEIEAFESDGQRYYWAFRSEPWWEGERGDVWLVEPTQERIASFDSYRGHLARYSRSTNITTELVDVGTGTEPRHYEDKSVEGKIVLASGRAGEVHRLAVWQYGAAGVLAYRTGDYVSDRLSYPDLAGYVQISPRDGPNGEPPGFVISISYRTGSALSERLEAGEHLVVQANVKAESRSGHYPQVHAVLKGTEPNLPEVWIQAHTDYRNTGGGNNLTGVGATLDLARSLSRLVADGRMPRPRRTIRFVWGAEHMALVMYFHDHPEHLNRVLALLDLDMVGDHQHHSQSILRLYRTPHSRPSFVNDICQDVFEMVAAGNTSSIRHHPTHFLLPILDPAGSRDQFLYNVEEFWGPSDHEDVGESSLGIHAVLLNTWPDPYLGTQEDTRERADATQMKRASVIAGAAALIMATAGPRDIGALAQNVMEKASIRLAREERRAMDLLWSVKRHPVLRVKATPSVAQRFAAASVGNTRI